MTEYHRSRFRNLTEKFRTQVKLEKPGVGKLFPIIVALTALIASGASSHADDWKTITGTSAKGIKLVSVSANKFEFTMEFRCDGHDWQDHRLGVKFHGPSLPRLYGTADATANLSLLFILRGGVSYRSAWDASYEIAGPDKQSWVGSINAGNSELSALAAAQKIEIHNRDGELVYRFAAKGTAAGTVAIRKHCKLGSD